MSRRAEIRMSDAELARLLAGERVVSCATMGPGGRPHVMPLWYFVDGPDIVSWTYGASQKVKNLERLPQATLLVEAGEGYHELRGAMLECDVAIVRDLDQITTIGATLSIKYLGLVDARPQAPDVRALVARQAAKRVGLRFRPTRVVTWDHSKLA